MHVVADFCLIPIGVSSIRGYIAEVQRVLQADPTVKFKMHACGTNIEGEWDDVTCAIKKCHERVHEMGCPRVSTDVRIGTRIDKESTIEGKIRSVEEELAKDVK